MHAARSRSVEAEHVFVLMTNEHRVSRNVRANWYFKHLNTDVVLTSKRSLAEFTEEIEIISVVPFAEAEGRKRSSDSCDGQEYYHISANTKVTFLARRYRFVFILDLSPSVSSVDIQSNSVLYEEIFLTLSRSLRGLCSPAVVPGSDLLFDPEICVTVLAHTPFYTSEGQQVLAQGWKINSENVDKLLSSVHSRLKEVTLSVAEVTASAGDVRNAKGTDLMLSPLFEECDVRHDSLTMTTPDKAIINMFRYGLLALQLLPEQSNTGIVMITDGMFSLPDASMLEILLTQLRNSTIACSFLQISSNPYPFSCFGYIPYTEIMKFVSTATFGAYLPYCPKIDEKSISEKEFNLYHRAFLAWNFQRGVCGFKGDEMMNKDSKWQTENPYFHFGKDQKDQESNKFQAKDQQPIRHKQYENKVYAKFTDLLSCRLREGYTIKEVNFTKNETQITVTLVLPFQHNCSLEYQISAAWSPTFKILENSEFNELTECRYEIVVESNYNFLHDVTCEVKKPTTSRSTFRNEVIKRFWSTVLSLSESDKFLVHLNNFSQSAGSTVPESIRSKIPLFYLPPNSSYPVLASKKSQSPFAQYWKQICLLDVNMWQKWMHTHRIKLILQHDTPLPKYLHLPSANGRYMHIQCRQSLQEVNTLLNNYSSFVMVENHSYIKLIQSSNLEPPESFFIIRVIPYLPLPYMVIYLAFVGGFSGATSQNIVDELKEMLQNCKFRKRNMKSHKRSQSHHGFSDDKKSSPDQDWIEISACLLVRKPVEKILIRYERAPSNFLCSFDKQIFESKTIARKHSSNLDQMNMLTLSKYLHHRRWVWVAQQGPKSKLSTTTMSKILSTLLKVRLQEGFRFAYNNSGIINVVNELAMEGNCQSNAPCVVQYIMFPPHVNTLVADSVMDNEEMEMEVPEADGEWQLITECWIEPQVGTVCDGPPHLENLNFTQIAESFFDIDVKIVSTLLTFEHIVLMCSNPSVPAFIPCVDSEYQQTCHEEQCVPTHSSPIHDSHKCLPHKEINVTLVPFCFDIVNLFTKCQQAELWFSTLISDIDFTFNSDISEKNMCNTRFVDKIVSILSEIHDREIYFNAADNLAFLRFIQQRSNRKLFPSLDENVDAQECPKWRCFAKLLSNNSLMVTVVPSSFRDLLRLLTKNHFIQFDDIPSNAYQLFEHNLEDSYEFQEGVKYCSLTLPIYVYKCTLSALTKQLSLRAFVREEDIFVNNLPKQVNAEHERKISEVSSCSDSKLPSPEFDHESDKKMSMKSAYKVIEAAVWMSLTKVVFETLQFGLNLDMRDIHFVLSSICDRTSIEIDIWPFLRCICGHVKDFCMQQLIEERIRIQASKDNAKQNSPIEKNFPLDLLQRHHPCDDLKQLHATIKKRFVDVLLQYVMPIKCKPSSFVFKAKPLRNVTESNTSNLSISKTLSNSTPNITETIDSNVANVSEQRTVYNRVHRESTSLPCSLSSRANSVSDSEDVSSCSSGENKELYAETDPEASPLFLDIQCSVKCNGLEGNFTLESMPTCLGDVTSCLDDTHSNIDINSLRVSLSIICLTLDVSPQRLFYASKRSTNLTCNNESENSVSIPDNTFSFIKTDSTKDFLSHLPDFQKITINKFMQKIQWMLQDEIVASYLKSHTITESVLNAVANHVENSEASMFCFTEEIPLKFVFDQENSLNKFKAIFSRKELFGYQLKREGRYYYLVYGEKEVNDDQKQISSLVPPLNFITDIESFHCVDSTELKQVCLENGNPGFKRDFSGLQTEANESFGLHSELTSSSLSASSFNTTKNLRTTRANSRLETEYDDDSDNSDDEITVSSVCKKRPLRKISKSREKSLSESRSASVPPPSPIEKCNEPQRKPGQSAPAEMFNFISSLKSPMRVSADDIVCEDKTSCDNVDESFDPEVCDIVDGIALKPKDDFNKRRLKDIVESSSSTPVAFNNDSKGQISTEVEDPGYDPGDSSDSDGELNWQLLDNKRPMLPSFWIILKIKTESVIIYFHTRNHSDKTEELEEAMNLCCEMKNVIQKHCRIVNQTVLLQHLHDSRMCDDLLVSNEETVVKQERCYSFNQNNDFSVDTTLFSAESTQIYEPGYFQCEEVWQTHFPLHPRLYSGGGKSLSRGIQAVRSVLNSFSVNNRQNMFVYQESSGNVFYIRLSEVACVGHSSVHDSNANLSRFSSVESLVEKPLVSFQNDIALEDASTMFRERVNSTASESCNVNDTLSVASQTSSVMDRYPLKGNESQDCIVLHVYGIGEVGNDIREEMTEALQKKLDEAVLDVLILALTRNPHCKLTPKDVFFIQKPKKPPQLTNRYFIRPKLLVYLHPIKIYLRQNLLNFLNNPKYTDSDPQYHFKAYSKFLTDNVIDDDDVFLHYRQQASGTSGSKGIACIIMSIVDGTEHFVRSISSPPVTVNTHCDLPLPADFEEEVDCKIYDEDSEKLKSPGPIAILRFQIWCVGKVDLEQLSSKLRDAVKCAFWDVVMEYRLLTVPLCEWNEVEESGKRRLGRIIFEEDKLAFLHQLEAVQGSSKEFFASVPDIRGTMKNPLSPAKQLETLNLEEPKKEVKSHENVTRVGLNIEFLKMVKIYRSTLRKWMDFGIKFGVPSISIKEYRIMSRRNIVHFVKELSTYITNLSSTINIKTYQCMDEAEQSFREVVDPNQLIATDVGVVSKYIMIMRNIQLWKAFIGFHEDRKCYLESLFSSKTKSNQRLPPHICNFKSVPSLETSGNPLSAVSHTSLSSYSQLDVKSCISLEEQTQSPFVPRQKVFLVLIEDKEIKFYIYNWSVDSIHSITLFAESLTNWLNSRTALLNSFVAQKMGLFHNQPFQRRTTTQQTNFSRLQRSDTLSSFPIHSQTKNQKSHTLPFNDTELLIEHHSPAALSKSLKNSASLESRKRKIGDILSLFRECVSADANESWTGIDDYVLRFGTQGRNLKKDTKDIQYLAKQLWHLYGLKPHIPFLDRMMKKIPQLGRLEHFCATPLLFTSQWRQKVSQVRDHTLEPVSSEGRLLYVDEERSRHSSGNSSKGAAESFTAGNRSRRLSGPPTSTYQNKTIRTSFDESWHFAVCTHYIQEYVQYLQTLGFVAIQLRAQNAPSKGKSKDETDAGFENNGNGGVYQKLGSRCSLSTNFLYKSLMGGLLIFEVGVNEPYVYSYLYSLDGKRLQGALMSSKLTMNQFVAGFLDEIDKVRVTMHLHSFTYDYHLRTIHSYISGRQLIFKQGYHLISFLEDFLKYYQKAPNYARNHIHAGELKMHNISVRADQLYNYITSHNEVYGMTVFRMVSSSVNDQDSNQSPEYVLVQLSSQSVPYRDHLDARQLDNFDIGLLICQNSNHVDSDKNSISLKYFVLLTSQRELYPKLYNSGIGNNSGSCRPIRLGASLPSSRTPSRKNSSSTDPVSDRENVGLNSLCSSQSTKENSLTASLSSVENVNRQVNSKVSLPGKFVKSGMCDEEVCYLGYFSTHETMMLQLLKEKADSAHEHLGKIVRRATVHCRRDYLWHALNQDNVVLTYNQFNELITLVHVKPISDFDPNLITFMNMHFSFYQNLAKTLNSKYGVNHKQFTSSDGRVVKHIYFNKSTDGFVMLSLNGETYAADVNVVLKEEPVYVKGDQKISNLSELLEDFVNGCAFHLWSTLAF